MRWTAVEVGSVPVARLDGVPVACVVLEPTVPLGDVRTVLGVPGPVLFGLDHPEATLRQEVEALGVVVHGASPIPECPGSGLVAAVTP